MKHNRNLSSHNSNKSLNNWKSKDHLKSSLSYVDSDEEDAYQTNYRS